MRSQTRRIAVVYEMDLEIARSAHGDVARDGADAYLRRAFMSEVRAVGGSPWWPSVVMNAPRLTETMRERMLLLGQVEVPA